MTEYDAQEWILAQFGERACAKLAQLADIVRAEARHQNLVAASTLDSVWVRHILDSAQLVQFASQNSEIWIDVGTGAGFPGLVVAILRDAPMILVEPRRRRADFLTIAAATLQLSARVTVMASKVEAVKTTTASVISARAVASVSALLASAAHMATPETQWILPKGLRAREEVAEATKAWHGVFHVEHSITDENSLIVIASKVSRR